MSRTRSETHLPLAGYRFVRAIRLISVVGRRDLRSLEWIAIECDLDAGQVEVLVRYFADFDGCLGVTVG